MKTIRASLVALALAMLLSGCGMAYMGPMNDTMSMPSRAILYTHTYTPLTTDMHRTRVGDTERSGDIKHLALCAASFAWDSAAIGDIAKKNGMKELYFADLETFSVLGIWNQYTVHVYGK